MAPPQAKKRNVSILCCDRNVSILCCDHNRCFSSSPGPTGAAAGATGATTGATGAAPGATGIFRTSLAKISLEDVMKEWENASAIRTGIKRTLYVGGSALLAASAATGTWAYYSMENRLSHKLDSALDGMRQYLREGMAKMEEVDRKEAEKREAAELKEKQRREDWEMRLQLLVSDILTKIINLEEKEWKHRQKVLQAEEVLKRFGFSNDADTYCEVAKQFTMIQLQVDSLKGELSAEKGAPAADKLLESMNAIDSQVTALRKMILEAGIVKESDLVRTGKGISSNQKVKK